MVFKLTGSDSRFQRKNWFWKICIESQDITKIVLKISLPNQASKIWHILVDISGLGAYFSKPIFALKPLVRAGWFEYHEPYNLNIFFHPIKGTEPLLGVPVAIVPDPLDSWNLFWYLLWPIIVGNCSQLIQIQKFHIFDHLYCPLPC